VSTLDNRSATTLDRESLLKGVTYISQLPGKRERLNRAIEEILEICRKLKVGEAAEIDGEKLNYRTVRVYVDELIESGKLPQEYIVRSMIRAPKKHEDRDAYIMHVTRKEVDQYRKRFARRRTARRI